MVTYYVVQGWQFGKRGLLIADEPREARSEDQCLRLAARLSSEGRAGVVAFSRTGDPQTGDWRDAVILKRYGEMPDDEDVLAMVG